MAVATDASGESVPAAGPADLSTTITAPRMSLCRRVEESWNRIQVGRKGAYSIERVESLDNYCKTTSLKRVILVCILTPVPALLISILLECIPLRSPSEGWKANWVFWIRFILMTATMIFSGVSQLVTLVPGLNATFVKRLIVAAASATAFAGTAFLAVSSIGFPLPFMLQLGNVVVAIYIPIVLLIVIGPARFSKNSPCFPYLERFNRLLFAYLTLEMIYPVFKMLYTWIPNSYKIIMVVILPMWQLAAKLFIALAARELEDFMPEIVAFNVDFFGSLFISVSIASPGTSMYLSVLFIAVDLGQTMLEFREVSMNAQGVLKLLQDQRNSRDHLLHNNNNNADTPDLLTVILTAIRNLSTFHVKTLKGVRLWACLDHSLTKQQIEQLQTLEASGVFSRGRTLSNSSSRRSSIKKGFVHSISVAPQPTTIIPIPRPGPVISTSETKQIIAQDPRRKYAEAAGRSQKIVQQGLQLLFHCEYLALVEYVECVVPLIFVIYKSVLEQLPNVVYYPGGAGGWTVHAVTNIMVFAALEVVSFVVLHAFLRRHFAFSPLYQLAFVLETQVYLVQCSLIVETLYLMQYELAHMGSDFTFRFEWLNSKSS